MEPTMQDYADWIKDNFADEGFTFATADNAAGDFLTWWNEEGKDIKEA